MLQAGRFANVEDSSAIVPKEIDARPVRQSLGLFPKDFHFTYL
ncbi:MAG: hypothetical protein DDT27_01524 [Dehalococcoidia bacterium]|nr:hypothetical protein [Chloroflexota bacterium]